MMIHKCYFCTDLSVSYISRGDTSFDHPALAYNIIWHYLAQFAIIKFYPRRRCAGEKSWRWKFISTICTFNAFQVLWPRLILLFDFRSSLYSNIENYHTPFHKNSIYWFEPISELFTISVKSVKRLVHSNGTIINMGCRKHTSRCSEFAHWDNKHKVRVETPPCCMKIMTEVLRSVTKDLQSHNIPHVLIFGAVLGFARNKRLVPYDNDVDIWMDGKHWDTPLFNKIRRKWNSTDGFHMEFRDRGQKLWVRYSRRNSNGVDIWPWYVRGGKVRFRKRFNMPYFDIPTRLLLPIRAVNITGISTFVPRDPEGYCERQYGKNWREEMKCTKVDMEERKCVAWYSVESVILQYQPGTGGYPGKYQSRRHTDCPSFIDRGMCIFRDSPS